MRALSKLRIGKSFDAIQRQLDIILDAYNALVANNPLLGGRLIENIEVDASGTPKVVKHGLGRPPKGWFVVSHQSNLNTYWQDRIAVASPETEISFVWYGEPTKISIYVF